MTAKAELERFMVKYEPAIARLAKKALVKLRKLTPGAIEMVYDNYNALVIGFGPSDKASLAVFSIAMYADHISLCFLQGAGLPDPAKRLLGAGTVARHVTMRSADTMDEPEIRELILSALVRAKVPIDPGQKSRMVIKSISKKQRPRRTAGQ